MHQCITQTIAPSTLTLAILTLHFHACVSGCTCADAPRENVALAQVAVLDVELQVRLLPEVPCARRAPEHLLLVAVFHRQVHLGERASERESAGDGNRCNRLTMYLISVR